MQATTVGHLEPQPGFQMKALATEADIAVLGGVAGCGKTGALLLEALRHCEVSKFGSTIFRRIQTQISGEGGLWDTAIGMYSHIHPSIRPTFKDHLKRCVFPSGYKLSFSHLNQSRDVYNWQGTQIGFLGFDELTHFEHDQFFYMLSRNRSISGVPSYTRATTNPQGHGWVKDFISWWLFPVDYWDESLADYPIPERDGVLRYMVVVEGEKIWGGSREEVMDLTPSNYRKSANNKTGIISEDIKTVSFISGKLDDNQILLGKDPGYKGNLLQLSPSEQEQLLKGRWRSLSADDRQMYNIRAIEDLFTNTFVEAGDNYLTCDIGLEGADIFVILHWSGWRVEHIYYQQKIKGDEVVRVIQTLAERHSVPRRNIAFDSDGVGNYLKGFLRTSYDFRGNATPIQIQNVKQNYLNLRTQCYYEIARFINDYGMFINANNNVRMHETIAQELRSILKAETKADGKLRIIPKDEIKATIGRSPDFADALMMRMVFELAKRRERPKTHAI